MKTPKRACLCRVGRSLDVEQHQTQKNGDPGRTRTPNNLIRSQVLYPVELRDRGRLIAVRKTVRKPLRFS